MAKSRYAYDSRLRPVEVFPCRSRPNETNSWSICIGIVNKYHRKQFGSVWERFPNSGHCGTAYFPTEQAARAVMRELGLDRYPEDAP